MKKQEIRLTSEMFQALLQGKRLSQIVYENAMDVESFSEIVIYPPNFGKYLTHEQIVEIRRVAEMLGGQKIIDLLNK